MGGVKRFHVWQDRLGWHCKVDPEGNSVNFSDFAAAQSELAASRKNTELAQESMQVFADEADRLQQCLADSERRNSELVELLREIQTGYRTVLSNYMEGKISSALKPTESGARE